MNPRSIHFRLIAWFAGLLVTIMAAFGLFTYQRLDRFVIEVQRVPLLHRAEQIAALLQGVAQTGEPFVATQIEARFAPELNDKFVRVGRSDGSLLFLSGPPNDHSFAPSSIPRAPVGPGPAQVRQEPGLGANVLVVAMPSADGRYRIEVGASLGGSNRVLHTLLLTLAAGLPVVLAFAILGGYRLVQRALDPVRSIMRAAQDITLHHLDRRLPVPASGDEIESLSRVLNQMIARLHESFQNTSRFTADASHELRTPLTIIRGELEALLLQRSLPREAQEALGSTLEEIERLVRIVEGLFALARLDTGGAQAERARLDLAALATTTVEQMCLLAEEKKIALRCETPLPVEVEGDRARLKQVIVNLLDNAIKYTPASGEVSLVVRAQNGSALLEVSDTGPGIAAKALPHIFERFYRADEVRFREVDGAGLGLSIVHSICQAHGGSVAAQNRAGGGSCLIVSLPRVL